MSRILVTGGAGFIGSHLVDQLLDKGHQVWVIDNLSTGERVNVNSKAFFINKDITDDLSVLFFEHAFDYVFHLAAQVNVRRSLADPKEDARINILGSINLAKECSLHDVKLIFSSSGGALYGPGAHQPCNEHSLIEPISPYGLAKYTVESYLTIFNLVHGLRYCVLRYSNVYGPRQSVRGEAGVIALFINALMSNSSPTIFGDGLQTRDFVYVNDVVSANLLAMGLTGTYNVGTGVETSILGLTNSLKSIMLSKVDIKHVDPVKGELLRNVLDCSHLKSKGWKSNFDLDSGLRKTVEWFTLRP